MRRGRRNMRTMTMTLKQLAKQSLGLDAFKGGDDR